MQKLFLATALSCILSSCFTSKLLKQAKQDRVSETVTQIQSAYLDSSNSLTINFTAKLYNAKKELPYHIMLNIDSLLLLYQAAHLLDYCPSTETVPSNKLRKIYFSDYEISPEKKFGTGIEFEKGIINQGFVFPTFSKREIEVSAFSSKKELTFRGGCYNKNSPEKIYTPINAKHVVFILQADSLTKAIKTFPTEYIALSIEASDKRSYNRYALLPASLAADGVTLPFQMIGFGLLYVTAMLMKF